jgi:ABC-type Mn2+/Zn2+ transport system ATPase subunit
MPTYTIFAGVNGAGKTSIFKSIYYEENKLACQVKLTPFEVNFYCKLTPFWITLQ